MKINITNPEWVQHRLLLSGLCRRYFIIQMQNGVIGVIPGIILGIFICFKTPSIEQSKHFLVWIFFLASGFGAIMGIFFSVLLFFKRKTLKILRQEWKIAEKKTDEILIKEIDSWLTDFAPKELKLLIKKEILGHEKLDPV